MIIIINNIKKNIGCQLLKVYINLLLCNSELFWLLKISIYFNQLRKHSITDRQFMQTGITIIMFYCYILNYVIS